MASKHRQMAREAPRRLCHEGSGLALCNNRDQNSPDDMWLLHGFWPSCGIDLIVGGMPDAPEPQLLQLLAVKLCYAIYGVAL